MLPHDITQTNVAVRRLINATDNPRHRFLLMAFDRHRNLEMAGRYEELFAPDMMVGEPVYHIRANRANLKLQGADAVRSLYRMWAATNQSVFYVENEEIAVADNFVACVGVGYQQVSARSLRINKVLSYVPRFLAEGLVKRVLARGKFEADDNSMYLYKCTYQMFWPYDPQGRLLGEDVWEPDPDKAEITKLDPADVLTMEQSRRLLDPLIKPLPAHDEMVHGARA
ncbi:hypothetical protein [Hyphomicrobium sp.]|uniref:hypothetical protein n=1 Tax=Hyphomicrobium sp. TaxID=82 RepID=UPI003F6EF6AF